MPGYNSSGTGALLALAKETKDKKIKEELINWLKLASECPYNSPAKIKKK